MRCKIGIVSIGSLSLALTREVEFMKLDADFVFSETLMCEGMSLPAEVDDVDVLISSGYNTKLLRKATNKPIINIEPTLYDILSAYNEAVSYDDKPVIIFPLKQYTALTSQINNLLSVPILIDVYEDVSELSSIIAKHQAEGCGCIVGSGLVCDKARQYGLRSVFIYPRESLQEYLQMAYDSANALRAKAQENKLMLLAINNARDIMLFTDECGVILICNQSAQSLFWSKIRGNLVGHSIYELIDNNAVRRLFSDHTPAKNVILELNDNQYILSGYPIYLRKNVSHVMLTLNSIQWIQRKELHIRQALSDKGFMAKHQFSDTVSRNEGFNALLQDAKQFAKSEDSILILGATGSGKEVLAQSIHNYSLRAEYPFVAVNCSAITESLLESELFGYDEGAFTGAKKGGKLGYFEMAHKGTIFLDEISELSLPMQSKLLRAIQEKQVIHVGGSRVIHYDARIIAATNRDLWEMVREHKFREDLYYRLAVLELNLPPLKERKEDVCPLFLEFMSRLNPELNIRLHRHAAELEPCLCGYSWPGNIRELENFAHMMSAVICPTDAFPTQFAVIDKEIRRRTLRTGCDGPEAAGPDLLVSSETERIKHALSSANGNYTKAAALLGISRTTLWRKLRAMERDGKIIGKDRGLGTE